MNIALIAHDRMKDSLEALGRDFAPLLRAHRLMATGTTGGRLRDGAGLDVECLLSGPLGGDLQIGSRIATGGVDLVIFLRDPMTPQPHEPDINALIRACDVHNVPCVTNPAGARILLAQLAVFGWMADDSAVMEPAAAATPIGMVEPIVVVAPVSVLVPVPERAHEFDPVSIC